MDLIWSLATMNSRRQTLPLPPGLWDWWKQRKMNTLCIFITLLWTTFPNSAWIIEKVWRRRNFFFCLVCLPSASVCNINLSSLCIKIIIILIFSKLQDYLSSLQRITGWKCITRTDGRTDGHFTRSWHDRGLVELVKELNKLKLKSLFPLNFDVWNLHDRPILK